MPEGASGPLRAVVSQHGTVHHYTYATKAALNLPNGLEDYYVYTPPGYDTSSSTYPTLYLLHGYEQHSPAWLRDGHIASALDALVASGKVRPMVVVMPESYGDYRFLLKGHIEWLSPTKINDNVALFSTMLLSEIVPRVESDYRVSRKQKDRAIAGLSMGGREAIAIGLTHPREFAWIGGFSPAFPTIEGGRLGVLDPDVKKLRLVWIGCGASDRLVFKGTMRVSALLNDAGVKTTVVPTSGTHSWSVWRDDFRRLAQLLFQAK